MDLNYQPAPTYLESEWLGYYKWTNESSEPWETLYKKVELFQEEEIEPQVALDIPHHR